MPVYSSRSRPGLFHPGSALGVLPFRGFPSQEAAPRLSLAHCPLGVFSLRPPAAMALPAVGALPTRLEFAAEPYFAFRASSSPRVRALPVSAFTSTGRRSPLGLLPPCGFPLVQGWNGFRRSSALALWQTELLEFPLGTQFVGAPAFSSSDAVALSLSRPPGRFEV